nr:carboxypeptidase-like regulatory domain-containing protein [Acidobacteriota bacterium]
MKKLLSVFFLLCAGLVPALAQTNTGRLVGTVASTDGVIAGATVTITDDKTSKDRVVTSAGDGSFTIPQLEVGTYTVKVTATGFKTFTATAVKIDIGREYALTATLEVGRVEDSVTIAAGADVLNATNGELSNTVSTKQIIELPLNGRNPLNL